MLLLHKLSPYIQVNLKHHDFLMQSAQVKIWSICNLFPCNPRHGPLITWPRPIICSSHYINPCNSFDFIWISFIYFKHHFWNMFVTYTVGHYSSQTHMLHMSLNSQLINLCVHWLSMCVGTGEWLMESRVFFIVCQACTWVWPISYSSTTDCPLYSLNPLPRMLPIKILQSKLKRNRFNSVIDLLNFRRL